MSSLIEAMRNADWSVTVPGVHGAVLIAEVSPEAKTEFKAFISGLRVGELEKGIRFLLKKTGMIEAK